MESLAPQQRKVMDIFARLGRPATPTELAEEARLQVNQVNSILKRLKDAGFVSLAPQERRKTTLYMVSERVFRIWHQMRFSAQGRRRLEFLIEFIRIWYSEAEWGKEADRLKNDFARSRSDVEKKASTRYIEHLQYMAAAAPSREAGYEIEDETIQLCIESGECKEAESILSERMLDCKREGNKERLSRLWYLKANVCHVQKDRPKEVEALSKAVVLKVDNHMAFNDWGCALSDWAIDETGERRAELFKEACGKYAQTLEIKGNDHEVFCNWGSALSDWAIDETGERRAELFKEACEKYAQAVAIKADTHEAFYNWGNALSDWARDETGERRAELFKEACGKYEQAVAIKADKHEAFNNWGNALSDWARDETGHEQARLLEQAVEKVAAAFRLAGKNGNASAAAFYAAHMVHLLLNQCKSSIAADNRGDALRMFSSVLGWLHRAEVESRSRELVLFFRYALCEKTASLCSTMLDDLATGAFDAEAELLNPFREAVNYWTSGKNEEVLDRLNPEMRKLVEEIVRGGSPEKDDRGEERR